MFEAMELFKTEYKNKKQLTEIKKKIERIIKFKIKEIKYNRSLDFEDKDFISGVTEHNIGFFISPYKNKDMLDKEIQGISRAIIKKYKEVYDYE